MSAVSTANEIPLPRGWPGCLKSASVQVVSLARLAIIQIRSWAANSRNVRLRLQGKLEQSRSEVSLLEEEIRQQELPDAVRAIHGSAPHPQRSDLEKA